MAPCTSSGRGKHPPPLPRARVCTHAGLWFLARSPVDPRAILEMERKARGEPSSTEWGLPLYGDRRQWRLRVGPARMCCWVPEAACCVRGRQISSISIGRLSTLTAATATDLAAAQQIARG